MSNDNDYRTTRRTRPSRFVWFALGGVTAIAFGLIFDLRHQSDLTPPTTIETSAP